MVASLFALLALALSPAAFHSPGDAMTLLPDNATADVNSSRATTKSPSFSQLLQLKPSSSVSSYEAWRKEHPIKSIDVSAVKSVAMAAKLAPTKTAAPAPFPAPAKTVASPGKAVTQPAAATAASKPAASTAKIHPAVATKPVPAEKPAADAAKPAAVAKQAAPAKPAADTKPNAAAKPAAIAKPAAVAVSKPAPPQQKGSLLHNKAADAILDDLRDRAATEKSNGSAPAANSTVAPVLAHNIAAASATDAATNISSCVAREFAAMALFEQIWQHCPIAINEGEGASPAATLSLLAQEQQPEPPQEARPQPPHEQRASPAGAQAPNPGLPAVSLLGAATPATPPSSTSKPTASAQHQSLSSMGSSAVSATASMLSNYLHAALPDVSSSAAWTSFLANDERKLKENPTSVLGGSMLALPGYRAAVTSAIGLLAESVPPSAHDLVVRHVDALCDSHDIAAAYYHTALKHPALAQLQSQVVDSLRAKPHVASHPHFERVAARFLSLGNTTDTKPYATPAAPASSFLEFVWHFWA